MAGLPFYNTVQSGGLCGRPSTGRRSGSSPLAVSTTEPGGWGGSLGVSRLMSTDLLVEVAGQQDPAGAGLAPQGNTSGRRRRRRSSTQRVHGSWRQGEISWGTELHKHSSALLLNLAGLLVIQDHSTTIIYIIFNHYISTVSHGHLL